MRVFECKISYSLVSLGEEVRLDRPDKIADYLRSAFDENPMQEAFYCVYLDRKNHPLGRNLITLGTLDSTLVTPREVFRGAILAGASALVVAHNHPSGDPAPSAADVRVTRLWERSHKRVYVEWRIMRSDLHSHSSPSGVSRSAAVVVHPIISH
mgnify:CR=1 FL=1